MHVFRFTEFNYPSLWNRALDHEGIIITEPSLMALADREESNRRGNLSVSVSTTNH